MSGGRKLTTYRARWKGPDTGFERSRSFPTRQAATNFLDTVRGDIAHGCYVDPAGARRPFREVAEQWRTSRFHRPSTQRVVERHLRLHIIPFFGERPIGSIRPSEIQAWVRARSEHLRPATVRMAFTFLSAIFKSATQDRLIGSSPCVGITLPKLERARVTPLEPEQIAALADAIDPRHRAMVFVGAGCGLRIGEVLGLTLENVDFLGRRLTVDRQLLDHQKTPSVLGPPKSPSSVRTIPMPAAVVDELAAHLARHPIGQWGLIFTDPEGRPISQRDFSDAWRAAVVGAQIPGSPGFHALRHAYASLLIRGGESVKVVQSRLGHSSAAITLDVYSHLWPDSEEVTRRVLDIEFAKLARPTHGPNEARNRV
jgi:integrase